MQARKDRRPSPALIVAIIALVAALAGSAVALPGKSSVKKNDIAKNAVVSKAIKNDKVKGVDIAESSLGQVPSAARADSAGKVDTQRHIGPVRLATGQEQVLDTRGPFTVTVRCELTNTDDITTSIVLTTSQNNAFAYSEWGGSQDTDIDVGEEYELGGTSSLAPGQSAVYSGYSAWTAGLEDGSVYAGERAYAGARIGGADCYAGIMPVF